MVVITEDGLTGSQRVVRPAKTYGIEGIQTIDMAEACVDNGNTHSFTLETSLVETVALQQFDLLFPVTVKISFPFRIYFIATGIICLSGGKSIRISLPNKADGIDHRQAGKTADECRIRDIHHNGLHPFASRNDMRALGFQGIEIVPRNGKIAFINSYMLPRPPFQSCRRQKSFRRRKGRGRFSLILQIDTIAVSFCIQRREKQQKEKQKYTPRSQHFNYKKENSYFL